jgi:acyl-homoserine lactone synthase
MVPSLLVNQQGDFAAMLHVVSSENRTSYSDQIEQSFRMRYQVFVKEKKWSGLACLDGREIDQFDTDDAIHLLALDETDRTVVGGCRLLPTTGPYLIPDVFPSLCARPIPRSPSTFEWGRLYIAAARREQGAMSPTSCHVMAGMVEFCLGEGINQLAVVSEAYWLPRFMGLGFKPELLGLPQTIEGTPTVAYTMTPSEDVLGRIREIHDFRRPSLVRHNLTKPVGPARSVVNEMSNK